MAFLSSFFKSFYTKALFVIIIGAIGITAGVKIGYTFLLTEQNVTFAGPQSPPASSMIFAAGDLFPWENYVTQSKDTGNFEQLLSERESVVFFLHLDCDRCLDLLELWHKEVKSELRPGVQQIACLPLSTEQVLSPYQGLFKDMTVVFYDDIVWQTKYHLVMSPVLIGVDKSGFVTHQQFGFEDYIQYPIVNRFCFGR